MNNILSINEIVNGSYKVTEKQKLLMEYKDKINKQIDSAIEEVEKGYKYCPQCREYYRIKSFEKECIKEERTICTYRDAGYGDDDKYERLMCTVSYSICPMGHKIEENISY